MKSESDLDNERRQKICLEWYGEEEKEDDKDILAIELGIELKDEAPDDKDEVELLNETTSCPFCSYEVNEIEKLKLHIDADHGVNIDADHNEVLKSNDAGVNSIESIPNKHNTAKLD